MLTIVGMFALIVFSSMFTACSQDDYLPEVNQTEKNQNDNLAISGTRASMDTFTDSGYNAYYGSLFTMNEAVKVDDRTYTFQVSTTASIPGTYEIYVKLYNHYTNNTYYEKLTQTLFGTLKVFTLNKQFITAGLFSYKYMLRLNYSNSLIALQSSSNKYDDFDTVIIPQTGNNYSSLYVYCGTDENGPYEQWGFYINQCTSWVAAKVNQMWGSYNTFSNSAYSLGNAKDWKVKLENAGYGVYNNAQAGDIIWWGANETGFSYAEGHVGFVHDVNSSGIQYSELNYDGYGTYRCQRKQKSELGNCKFIRVRHRIVN